MTGSDAKKAHTELISLKASLFDSITRFPAYPAVFDHLKQELVASILVLGGKVNSQVIAEGIETDRELGALRDLGVPLGQGLLFGLPDQEFSPPTPLRV